MKNTIKKIEERMAILQAQLENAEKYLASGENIEGKAYLHLDDWDGNSGHPEWVKNKMIPTVKKMYREAEKALEIINKKYADKNKHEIKEVLP